VRIEAPVVEDAICSEQPGGHLAAATGEQAEADTSQAHAASSQLIDVLQRWRDRLAHAC